MRDNLGLFPVIQISGAPFERGHQYGKSVAERIQKTWNFYRQLMKLKSGKDIDIGAEYLRRIGKMSGDYADEIRGISQGCGLPPEIIALINARSEVLLGQGCAGSECTSVYFPSGIMGQTWDWAEELLPLAIILRVIYPSGHRCLMMVEPGMIGKIGLNDRGIGVALNWLDGRDVYRGAPIHVIARAILDEDHLVELEQIVPRMIFGQSGNLLVGDSFGRYINYELGSDAPSADGITYRVCRGRGIFAHTNHRLGTKWSWRDLMLTESFLRKRQVMRAIRALSEKDLTLAGLQKVLSDPSGICPVARRFLPSSIGPSGTVCAIAMDLRAKEMHITRGNPRNNTFDKIPV